MTRTAPHVRVETRKVYVSVRGPKLTRHAAYIGAAKALIAKWCDENDHKRGARFFIDIDDASEPVDAALVEHCDKTGNYQCRFHRLSAERYHHDGEPVEGSGRMEHYNRVLPRLVRFLKLVDRRMQEHAEQPYVCPGCYAVGGKCAPGCDEERMQREREDEIERGEYDGDGFDDLDGSEEQSA